MSQVEATGSGGSSAGDRDRAAEELRREIILAGHRGEPEMARGHLEHPDARVRVAVLGALDRAGDLRPGDLATALADSAPVVRCRAAELAASMPGDAGPRLGALLADPDPTVVEVASWASGERTPPEPGVLPRLAEIATGHDEPLCREAAVAALGALGDESGLAAVLAATRDRPAVRRRAVLALAAFSGPEVEEALDRARGDRDWQVRQAAEDVG